MADEGPSLPSNYVTILHLKERWLKHQQQHLSAESNPNHRESDSQSTVEPKDDSASKIPNESVHRRRNRHPIVNQAKSDVTVHDSASKTPYESVRNRNRVINQLKPEVTLHDSASKSLAQVADNHPVVENQEQNTDQSNSKLSTTKNSSRGRNPRSVTNQILTGGSTTLSEPERVPEKQQHRYKGGRRNRNRNRNRNQEGREPKGKTPPVAQNVDDSSHNDSGGDGVIEAVAAAVKERNVTDVSQRTNRRCGSGRFYGGPKNGPAKPPVGVKTTTVWVRKGESVQD